ncbi:MAG: glycosyltransferase family 2 protein [Candidatus Moranbacteria bacterium]|nr:glycosyltransferase family 2 protein [Candidatus Moranbacteria bacterium]
MKLTIQIVNFRSRHYLEKCLFSIAENLPVGIKTDILVVNNEEDSLGEIIAKLGGALDLQVHEIGKNIGFGRAHNAGFGRSQGDVVLFLNPDTTILPGALQALLDVFEDQRIGIAGPFLVDSAEKIEPDCFGNMQTPLSMVGKKMFGFGAQPAGVDGKIFQTGWISGGAMLVRRDVFEKMGGFDEKFFMYFEDVDLCLRVKKQGTLVAVNPKARIFHESGKSFASEREKKAHYYTSQDYYIRKHFGPAAAGLVKLLRLPYYVKNVYLKR